MKLLVSALEPSSNLHLKEVLKHTQDVELTGIFDKSIKEGTPLYDLKWQMRWSNWLKMQIKYF